MEQTFQTHNIVQPNFEAGETSEYYLPTEGDFVPSY